MFAPARHPVRFLWRAAMLIAVFASMTAAFFLKMGLRRRRLQLAERADWVQRYARKLLSRALPTRLEVSGRPPATGLIVCNHLSYLDIPVLALTRTAAFVAKADVKGWPVFGWYARHAGTLFIQREKRRDVGRITEQMREVLQQGHVLVLFPEGTSSGGATVLPFRSSLLEPVAGQQFPVTPAALSYALDDGDPAEEVCYWKDMTLFPHLLNLLTKREIRARVVFGEARVREGNRKELARELHAEVLALKNGAKAEAIRESTGGRSWTQIVFS